MALNFEARGNAGPVIMFETTEGNGWMIDDLAAAAPDPVANSLSYEIYRRMPNDTDLTVFKRRGLPGMNFAHIAGLTHYHTAADDTGSVSEDSLQHHGSYALSLARRFGASGLGGGGRADAVYFNLPGPVFVRYGGALVIPLAALAALLYAGVPALGFRRGRLTARGVAFGTLALAASGVAAAAAVTLAWRLARPPHRGFESTPWGDPYGGGVYVIAMVLLAVAVVAALYNWFRRGSSVANLTAGALLWSVVLAACVGVLMPGVSYMLVWPLLFALAGAAVLFATPERELTTARWVVLAPTTVPAVALFSPLVQQAFTALTLNAAGLVAVPPALLCGLLVPHLQMLAGRKPWVFPTIAAALALALVAGGFAAARAGGAAEMNNVFYGLNADTGEALWASADAAPDSWTSQFFPNGGARRQLADVFPVVDDGAFLTAAAAPAPLPAPEAKLVEDARGGETRVLRLRVSSPRKAPLVSLYVGVGGELLGASINGLEAPARVEGPGLPGRELLRPPGRGGGGHAAGEDAGAGQGARQRPRLRPARGDTRAPAARDAVPLRVQRRDGREQILQAPSGVGRTAFDERSA